MLNVGHSFHRLRRLLHRLSEQQQLRRVDSLRRATVDLPQRQTQAMREPFILTLELRDRRLLLVQLGFALLQLLLTLTRLDLILRQLQLLTLHPLLEQVQIIRKD